MAEAKHDNNRETTVIGVSSDDFETPIVIAVNPTTHALIVKVS